MTYLKIHLVSEDQIKRVSHFSIVRVKLGAHNEVQLRKTPLLLILV